MFTVTETHVKSCTFIIQKYGQDFNVKLLKKMKQFLDCNCWALCCAGFGLGVVLAVFASLKLVLILAGFLLIALGIRILLL